VIRIAFQAGTVVVEGVDQPDLLPDVAKWDPRTRCHRAPAVAYAEIVMACVRAKLPYTDDARDYSVLPHGLAVHRTPRPFQKEALDAWNAHRKRGVVVLPTGAGKTYVAHLAIDAAQRSTLVVVPTLNLVAQWHAGLKAAFNQPVGIVGGGSHDVQALTVTTYDSAYIHMEHLGARFGLIIFDECHHLPGEAYTHAALMALAPFRLGLSATPERPDGRHELFTDLIGPLVYRQDVIDLKGHYLAEYTTEQVVVDLTPAERAEYESEYALYRSFVVANGIRMGGRGGWQRFIQFASRSAEGRRALEAHRRQRRLAFAAPSKLDYVGHLLEQHHQDRVLLFTQNNDTAYEVSRRFLVPIITHQTKPAERSVILQGFAAGTFSAIATSKVLNEGVDVPDANVAIVISGSGSVREHVQRLGRILRKKGDKQATLYVLVAGGTAEAFTSERRREHNAYR
jgi:superfamily II DNA or RNA helicase